jgi:hypothetical protein
VLLKFTTRIAVVGAIHPQREPKQHDNKNDDEYEDVVVWFKTLLFLRRTVTDEAIQHGKGITE